MELPQSRPFRTDGKKPTHDFMSLYTHSSSFPHQDPRPSPGIYLKTRDFLQPLEMVGKSSSSKGESIAETSTTVEKPAAPPRPPSSSSSSSIEHVLPGGIGTYTISHISNITQMVPKPERSPTYPTIVPASSAEKKSTNEANKAVSNSSSYSGGGSFSLWGESVVEKGTSKKGITSGQRQIIREPLENLGQWTSEQQPLQAASAAASSYILRNASFNSLPSSSSKEPSRRSQSFMEMMKSGKGLLEDEDDDDDFMVKKGNPSQKELTVKVDRKNTDQKANTPRSKHSATEQRRRSKINDRFQILRDLIPLNDQKRDKASFLLEVIEYIQFLQEKVNKYESSYPGWNQEPSKLMPWRNRNAAGERMVDHSRVLKNGSGPGLVFGGKLNENNISITPAMLANASQSPVDNDRMGATYKPMDQRLGVANKALSFSVPVQSDMHSPAGRSGSLVQPLQRSFGDAEHMASQPESHSSQNRPCTTGRPAISGTVKDQEAVPIERGTISISDTYSQGLLNNLTQALERSGVDLSQANISVQIDLGKRAISKLSTISSKKDYSDPSSSNRVRPRDTNNDEDSDQARKRLKTEKAS